MATLKKRCSCEDKSKCHHKYYGVYTVPHYDQKMGRRKHKQIWKVLDSSKRKSEHMLEDIRGDVRKGQHIHPSKCTVGEWLDRWLVVKEPTIRPNTKLVFRKAINTHLKPSFLGAILIQHLTAMDIQRYYAEKRETNLAEGTLSLHQAVLHNALQSAKKHKVVLSNVAQDVDGKPRRLKMSEKIEGTYWDEHQTRRFCEVADTAGPRQAAMYALFLNLGLRRSELAGLRWKNVTLDFERGVFTIGVFDQLTAHTPKLEWGPLKNNAKRTLEIDSGIAVLLKRQWQHLAELKLKFGPHFRDHDLVFCKEESELYQHNDYPGDALCIKSVGEREFQHFIEKAGVPKISLHGLRHTCATLLLKAGQPLTVVSQRLGHKRTSTTADIYAHVLPSMQADASKALVNLIHG